MFDDYFGHLALEITNACNLKCKMCSIWREQRPAQLSEREIKNIIKDLYLRYKILKKNYKPLVTLTGGEPFLHPQFDGIYKQVQEFRKSGLVGNIYIITNGYLKKRILDFLNENDHEGLRLDFSLDGLEKNHNEERGDKNSYKNLTSSIDNIREAFPEIPVSVKFTINNQNYKDIFQVYENCMGKGIQIRFLFVVFPWNGYYNRANEHPQKCLLEVGEDQRKEITAILLKILRDVKGNKKWDMIVGRKEHMISIIKNVSMNYVKRCTSPAKELFINSHGEVYPCIYKKPIANIRDKGWVVSVLDAYHERLIREGLERDCPMKHQHCNFLKVSETALF
jgi:MoaA/NifB/PqqE/SkfB family radical SAM enzyme